MDCPVFWLMLAAAAVLMRAKFDAVAFGWFHLFFFVGTGLEFDLPAVTGDSAIALPEPFFLLLFLLVRAALAWLICRQHIEPAQRLPFAVTSAVPALSIIVVITGIGRRTKTLHHEVAAVSVAAALLSVLVLPTIAGTLWSGHALRLTKTPARFAAHGRGLVSLQSVAVCQRLRALKRFFFGDNIVPASVTTA